MPALVPQTNQLPLDGQVRLTTPPSRGFLVTVGPIMGGFGLGYLTGKYVGQRSRPSVLASLESTVMQLPSYLQAIPTPVLYVGSGALGSAMLAGLQGKRELIPLALLTGGVGGYGGYLTAEYLSQKGFSPWVSLAGSFGTSMLLDRLLMSILKRE